MTLLPKRCECNYGVLPAMSPTVLPIKVGFKRLNDNASIPTKAHASDSGFDLYASEDIVIEPGETAVVPTAIAVQLPEGCEATIRPRSGVTSRTKLRVQLGTIDNQYRGEVGVIVDNIDKPSGNGPVPCATSIGGYIVRTDYETDSNSIIILKGDKLAQMVVQHLPQVEAVEVTELGEGERGANGFGSTGVREESE